MEVLKTTTNLNTITEIKAPVQKPTIKEENNFNIDNNDNIKDDSKITSKNTPNTVKTSLSIINTNEAYQKTINPTTEKKDSSNEDIYYINGILTKSASAEKQTQEVANLLGKPVTLLYNPTEGFAKDVLEAALQVMNIENDKSTVNDTADRFYDTLKSGKELKIVAHSQGAAITAQALAKVEKKLLFENEDPSKVSELLKKVTVTTIGGASSKEDYPKGVSFFEIKHKDDIVPKFANKTGVERPENLLYKIKETKDKNQEKLLWSEYEERSNQRALGKVKVALSSSVACSVSVVCEYFSLKTGLNKSPNISLDNNNLKILDVINKNHDALPNTEFKTGYLVNKEDRDLISKNIG
ncbi:MAG: hypothetical protein U0457_12325 [Candidatus Sericytochromatia bacterium]